MSAYAGSWRREVFITGLLHCTALHHNRCFCFFAQGVLLSNLCVLLTQQELEKQSKGDAERVKR